MSIAQLSKTKGKKSSQLVLPTVPVPQVNLLPPEVGDARKADVAKRWAVIAVIAAVALSAIGWGVVQIGQSTADGKLNDAQAATAQLRAEQQRYAEVPQVLAQQDVLQSTRDAAFATDVDWATYLAGALVVLPEGASMEMLEATLSSPMTGEVAPVDALDQAGIGQLTIVGRSLTVPDSGALIAAMNSIQGLTETRVTSVEYVSDPDDGVFYRVSLTAQVNQDALRPNPFSDGED
ncbi:MAG: hypothetical protein LBU50_01620 [Cellulomonas sp.]|jgi:hypothetical protein|nr:hypothetical protein [Cellulomonas sp.]